MKFLAILIGFAISIIGYILLLPEPDDGSRFAIAGSESYLRIVVLYLLMLIGIFAKSIHDLLSDDKEVVYRKLLSRAYRSSGFVKAIVISPLVFFSVYNVTHSQPDNMIAVLLSFQNGFFWQAVMENKKKKVAAIS